MGVSNSEYNVSSNAFYLGDNVLLCKVFLVQDILPRRRFVEEMLCIGHVMLRRRFVKETLCV
jgi:hypothetical protein